MRGAKGWKANRTVRPPDQFPTDLLKLGFDVLDGRADGLDLLGVFVRDVDLELILELHDQLDGVERVGA